MCGNIPTSTSSRRLHHCTRCIIRFSSLAFDFSVKQWDAGSSSQTTNLHLTILHLPMICWRVTWYLALGLAHKVPGPKYYRRCFGHYQDMLRSTSPDTSNDRAVIGATRRTSYNPSTAH